jgi:hypothetical protein
MFVCLNPSTADATVDDPTLRRCIGFAKSWGYGGVLTGNLFGFRATDPSALRVVSDPVGPRNNKWLTRLAHRSDLVIAGWGNDGSLYGRSSVVRQMFPDLHYLKMNQAGEPAHPLYLPSKLTPVPMLHRLPEMPENVEEVFSDYPVDVRRKMEKLRQLIYEVGRSTDGVGPLEETLKWGEPAYLTVQSGSGSTIRIHWQAKKPDQYALYFNCQTTLVDTFRSIFPDTFRYEGNRALVLTLKQRLPKKELGYCISLALRYHLDKKKR